MDLKAVPANVLDFIRFKWKGMNEKQCGTSMHSCQKTI